MGNMKAFTLLALIPLVAGKAAVPFTVFTHGAHAVHAAPVVAHHAIAPAYHAAPVVHHAPAYHAAPVVHQVPAYHAAPAYHKPAYHAYEQPKHNCSVQDVVEAAEVCTPALETLCDPIELSRLTVVDAEQCYIVTRTVCTESIEEIDNEVCTYSYQPKTEATTAKSVEVSFKKECDTQMVTVCQPTPGYGYHSYGHNCCKEVAQETCYNVPILTVVEPAVMVAFPEPIKSCVDKPIDLIRISCEGLTAEKCITVPEVEEGVEEHEKCITQLAAPNCNNVDLTLPKQVCTELNYGYAEDTHEVEEPVTYAPT